MATCCKMWVKTRRTAKSKGDVGMQYFGVWTAASEKLALKIVAVLLVSCALLQAGEQEPAELGHAPPQAFPLWDGQESVAAYAKRVNLPPTRTFDLGNGVELKTVLIPAGKFSMGSPEYEIQMVGQMILGISGGILLLLVLNVLVRAWKKRRQPLESNPAKSVGFCPQFSLGYLLLMTFAASFCVMGGVRWHEALKNLNVTGFESPAHEVTLTKPFYMSTYPVTQEQYQQVMGMNPSIFKGNNNPVETVSWNDAQEFCTKVTERMMASVSDPSPLAPDPYPCCLPTEAEWEYACRAGTRTAYHSGDSEDDLKRVAWFKANSGGTTHPVGKKESNVFGLYDMHGNVWQWCQDWCSRYSQKPVTNPQGPALDAYRVLRGGSWHLDPKYCRTASRIGCVPDHRPDDIGFRVVVPACRTP